jgi:pSer/pThr/pTyr-binding forkhead associated (FHA) protein
MLSLNELESHIQNLLEDQLLKFLPGYKPEDRIFQQLAVAMYRSLKEQSGITFAPNIYVIITHPTTINRWQIALHGVEELAEILHLAGERSGFKFLTKPVISTAVDPDMTIDEIHIIASYTSEGIPETQELIVGGTKNIPFTSNPRNAFLILGGTKIIPLDHPVINVGRRLDNQVVIDDPRVSRLHAQLRIVKDHFVLFDLNSTGGTYINGRRTVQSILTPGDVISLAGITLIFGQDLPLGNSGGQTITRPNLTQCNNSPTLTEQKPDKIKNKKASAK